jgi:DNA-binding response OmpR family regulator
MSSAAENSLASKKKYTILVVDDNSNNLRAIEHFLKEAGFSTLTAAKGELALKRAQYSPPDLILLDVKMPGIDGFETCRRLKADETTRGIPVIFMTALTSVEDKMKGFEAGGVDYITKPIQTEEMLARISTHLNIRDLQQQLQQQNKALRHEIAERKKTEEALRSAQEEVVRLEKEALERQMAGGFAHEMRNTLAGIELVLNAVMNNERTLCQDNSETLNRIFELVRPPISEKERERIIGLFEMIDKNEEELDKVLRMIQKNTDRAQSVITLILDYARLSKAVIGDQEVFLKQVIETIVQDQQSIWTEQQITVRVQGDIVHPLIGDPSHFALMIKNLVLNAYEAIQRVKDDRDQEIEISFCKEGTHQIVTISDNADGIAEEHLSHIFEPFYSTNPPTGVGLGLCFVSKLVSLYNGTIDVKTEIGKGTIITLVFPYHVAR